LGFCFLSACFNNPVKSNEAFPLKIYLKNISVLNTVLDNPEKYKLQVIYTQIDRNENNEPEFKDFTIKLDDEKYFYPASTVKLPTSILALEWLSEQKSEF
jgi:disulfide oxidoreductase YuzD